MDYDKTDIPTSYDRGRVRTPEVLELWMKVVSTHARGRAVARILDLGCGTARFSETLAQYFDAKVIGIDPSTKMLEQARMKTTDRRVRYGLGHGEAIPLVEKSVDLIFMSMVFHHFEDPKLAARECRRVLRNAGVVFLRAGTVEQIPTYPYVPFFPTSRPVLERRLNGKNFIVETFAEAGFSLITWDLLIQEVAPSYAVYADQLAAGADSVLTSLSQDEFDAGLTLLRDYAARVDTRAVTEEIDYFVFQ